MFQEIIFSNQLDTLASHLQERLFSTGDPFEKRLVIVPHLRLKSYLMQLFAKNMQVAAGMQISTLPQALSEFIYRKRIPSQLELALQLEEYILEWDECLA